MAARPELNPADMPEVVEALRTLVSAMMAENEAAIFIHKTHAKALLTRMGFDMEPV